MITKTAQNRKAMSKKVPLKGPGVCENFTMFHKLKVTPHPPPPQLQAF